MRGTQTPDRRVRGLLETMNKLSAKISPASGPIPITFQLPTTSGIILFLFFSSFIRLLVFCINKEKCKEQYLSCLFYV